MFGRSDCRDMMGNPITAIFSYAALRGVVVFDVTFVAHPVHTRYFCDSGSGVSQIILDGACNIAFDLGWVVGVRDDGVQFFL